MAPMKTSLRILILIFSFLIHLSSVGHNNPNQYNSTDTLSLWINMLQKKCEYYKDVNPDSCIYYANLVLQSAEGTNDSNLLANAYQVMGEAYFANSQYLLAIRQYNRALQCKSKFNSIEFEAGLLLKLGKANTIAEKYNEALADLLKAQELYKELNILQGYIEALILTGEYFRKIQRHGDAINYLMKAEELITEEISNSGVGIQLYSRMAAVHSEMGNHEAAIAYSRIAYELAKDLNNLHYQAMSLNELGFLYEKESDPGALQYYIRAASIWKRIGYKRYHANVLVNIARLYYLSNQLNKSLQTLDTLENLIKKENWRTLEYDVLYRRSVIYRNMGDFEKAYYLQELCFEIFIEIYSKEKDERIEEIKSKYEVKEKELRIEKQEKQLELEKAKTAAREKRERWIVIVGCIIFLSSVLLTYAYFALRNERKKLNRANKDLELLNEQITSALEQKEIIVREMYHRVKNNLNMLTGLIHLQLEGALDTNTRTVVEDLRNRAETISFVHQQLLDLADKPRIRVGDFFEKFISNITEPVTNSKASKDIVVKCPELFIPLKSAIPIVLITNELVTNSIKHAYHEQDDFLLGVEIECMLEHVNFRIYDNGPGINNMDIINKPKTVGFKLVQLLAKQLDAELHYSNNKYSEFNISFKLKYK